MNLEPIKSDADYEAALAEIDRLMEARPGTPDGERLDALATLVEAYKVTRFSVDTHR